MRGDRHQKALITYFIKERYGTCKPEIGLDVQNA
jgi:hypothetical protein